MARTKTKARKITASAIMEAMQVNTADALSSVVVGNGEPAIEVPIRTKLSLQERVGMEQDILDMVFVEDGDGAIEYCPAFRQFAFDFAIVNYFTTIELPSNGEKAADFLEKTRIAHVIADALQPGYIADIINEAVELIELRKASIAKKSKFDSLLDGVMEVVNAIKKKTDGADLAQILTYAQENVPELKGEIEQLLKSQVADATASE